MNALRSDAGFTVVEALAAFTILAISLIVLLSGVSTAMQRDAASILREDLLRLARSELDVVGLREPLAQGIKTGVLEGGYRWTLITIPYALASPRGLPQAFWVEIVVASPGPVTREVRLETLKLQSALP